MTLPWVGHNYLYHANSIHALSKIGTLFKSRIIVALVDFALAFLYIQKMNHSLFAPVCAQALLTFVVWLFLMYSRVVTPLRLKIDPNVLSDESHPKAQILLKAGTHLSDNFENLFEIPILFYVASLTIAVTRLADVLYVKLLWAFVILRILHSLIHCTYNTITHRFATYFLSSLVVWVIWIRLAGQCWTRGFS